MVERINCPRCAHATDATASFCEQCGARLDARICGACRGEIKASANFCPRCGADAGSTAGATASRDLRAYTPKHLADKILQSKSALEGERKQVTVLFADVKGSMELAEQVDSEEWHHILDDFFRILANGVHRFEGTVNQYTGDGIMALFGAPIAHEDHAARACYAALQLGHELRHYAERLRIERGLGFSVRMGLNSGEVVVGRIGDDLRMDYTAQGPTVGLAQRMEQLAAPDATYLTGHTAKLVEGRFALRDLGASSVKGASAPVRVFQLEGVGKFRTRLEVARARGLTRFVGRDDDLQTLDTALAQVQQGAGQVVGVMGEAGLGKSRLCFEFLERCRAAGFRVLEGRGVAHGKNVPLLPILQVFRAYYGISEDDDEQTVREKIAGRLLLLDERFREVLPVLFEFFGVPDSQRLAPPMDPEARRQLLFSILRRIVQHSADRDVTVVLIEDLHWLDVDSEEWLTQWAEAVAGTRNLLLVNFRPGYHAPWMQQSHYHQLPLVPLGPGAVDELVADLLGHDASLVGLATMIHERTGGNPFFAEEVIQELIEGGGLEGSRGGYRLAAPVERLVVPSTVQATLAARVDRLPEVAKDVLQAAAVIGKDFTEPVLSMVVALSSTDLAGALDRLKAGEFVYVQSLYPVAKYAFKHPLTQEVAYLSQLRETRSQRHALVAGAIEAHHPDKLDEHAALLAHHWEEAGHALEAAQWCGRAARWTEDRDPYASLRWSHKVRALLADTVASAENRALRIAACRGILSAAWRVGGSGLDSDSAEAVFAEGKALAERNGDLRSLAILFSLYGNARGTAGDMRTYRELATEALGFAERSGDPVIRAAIASDAHPFVWTGRLREAVKLAEEGIALGADDLRLGREVDGMSAHIKGLVWRGAVCLEMGRLEAAGVDLDRAIRLSAEEQPTPYIWAQAFQAIRGYRSGDGKEAMARARRAVERAEAGEGSANQAFAHTALGFALLVNGQWAAAEDAAQRALVTCRSAGVGFGSSAWALVLLAEAHLGQGDVRTGLQVAEAALAEARQSFSRLFEIDALLMRARALLDAGAAGGTAEARRTLIEASELIDESDARCRTPVVHEIAAALAGALGDETTRTRELRDAHRLYSEMGAIGHAERLASQVRV